MNSGRRRTTSKAGLLLVVLALLSTATAQSAGFDCAKATTKIEKMICADSELSRLDKEMKKAFDKALPKAPDPSVVKQQQKKWLSERNHCMNRTCLHDQYQLRLGELQRIIDLVPLTTTEESYYFAKESEKLKVIRDVVRRQSFAWYNPHDKEPEFCKAFKKDFIEGLHLEPVEPDFRTDDAHDPRFAKLNNCTEYYRQGAEEPEQGAFWGVEYWGGPPYRYYSVELDGNSDNGKEVILYHEPTVELRTNGTGYGWIDLHSCISKAGASQDTRWRDTPRYLYRLTTLAKYKGELIMVGISPSAWAAEITSYNFKMWRFSKREHLLECAYHFDIKNNKATDTLPAEPHGGKRQ